MNDDGPSVMLRARVTTTERMEHLVVSSEDPRDRYLLAGALRRRLGDLRLVAEGILVPLLASAELLDISEEEVSLTWSEPARRYAENRRRVAHVHMRVHGEVERLKVSGSQTAAALITDLDDVERLDGHQIVNVALMCEPDSPGLCVFDEQGAGKTVTVIFAFDLLAKRNEADTLIVLAPKSMVPEWPRDVQRFKGDLYRTMIISGSRREKRTALRSAADVLVTNFETAISMEEELTAIARTRSGRAVLVVDESFYVKNLDAKRTQAIRRLREWCGRAFVLCGTPAPNRPEDLIQQFNIVDFGFTFHDVDVPDDRHAAVAVIQQAVNQRGLFVRHLKQDVLPDLPTKAFERVLVPLQPQQMQLYQGALRSLIVDLETTSDEGFQRQITSFLARRMALLQICSHPAMVAEGYVETPSKLLALDAILADLIDRRKEKVIVWSFFRHSIEHIVQRYSQYGVVRYDGSISSVEERRDAVRRFQEDDETRLFVANPAAAGAGLTLHRARIAIYESMSNQAAHYLQSVDRIHRRGQERNVEYLMLLGDETVEVDEYDRLLAKERTAQNLLGDVVESPMTRESMLADLLNAAARIELGSGGAKRIR
jgi:SNF2 family DNA or RNA helicase